MGRRGGLGKGLGALIPAGETGKTAASAANVAELEEELQTLPIHAIRPNQYQPRERFDEEALGELADSIRQVGLLQPVLVRPVDDGWELVAGERRWRAARRAGLETIPALVRPTGDADALEQALVENLHRDDLNALEEASAYQQLVDDFGLSHEQIAARVGRSRATVSNTLRLLALPPAVQRLVRDGELGMGHARALLGTPDRARQERLAHEVVAKGMSVREVEDAVRDEQAGAERPAGARRTGRLRPPGLLELESLLGDYLETRVKVTMSAKRGRVMIDFSTLEDLERIYYLVTERRATRDGDAASGGSGAS